MWLTPALSPAKILQGNGRIMRDTELKRPAQILDSLGKLVPSPNSYIIAPSVWYGGTSANSSTVGGGPDIDKTIEGDDDNPRKS